MRPSCVVAVLAGIKHSAQADRETTASVLLTSYFLVFGVRSLDSTHSTHSTATSPAKAGNLSATMQKELVCGFCRVNDTQDRVPVFLQKASQRLAAQHHVEAVAPKGRVPRDSVPPNPECAV